MLCCKSWTPLSKKVGKVMKEKLYARLSDVLERDLTKVEEAIIDWTIVQVEIEKMKESN